jgi:hypothetical protein
MSEPAIQARSFARPSETAVATDPTQTRAPTTNAVKRGPHRWQKGMASPNPGGRPIGLASRVREIVDFDKAIETLVEIAWGKLAPASRVADRIKAIELLFDRGHGKAVQAVEMRDGPMSANAQRIKQMPTEKLIATVEAMRALAAGDAPTSEE